MSDESYNFFFPINFIAVYNNNNKMRVVYDYVGNVGNAE